MHVQCMWISFGSENKFFVFLFLILSTQIQNIVSAQGLLVEIYCDPGVILELHGN